MDCSVLSLDPISTLPKLRSSSAESTANIVARADTMVSENALNGGHETASRISRVSSRVISAPIRFADLPSIPTFAPHRVTRAQRTASTAIRNADEVDTGEQHTIITASRRRNRANNIPVRFLSHATATTIFSSPQPSLLGESDEAASEAFVRHRTTESTRPLRSSSAAISNLTTISDVRDAVEYSEISVPVVTIEPPIGRIGSARIRESMAAAQQTTITPFSPAAAFHDQTHVTLKLMSSDFPDWMVLRSHAEIAMSHDLLRAGSRCRVFYADEQQYFGAEIISVDCQSESFDGETGRNTYPWNCIAVCW